MALDKLSPFCMLTIVLQCMWLCRGSWTVAYVLMSLLCVQNMTVYLHTPICLNSLVEPLAGYLQSSCMRFQHEPKCHKCMHHAPDTAQSGLCVRSTENQN